MNDIFFKESGSGFPLLLLHGFCENNSIWEAFRHELADDFHVICPDLPGFGKSTLPENPFTLEKIGDMLAGWLRSKGIRKYVVVGHSLGGYVALELLRKYDSLVNAIGLFNSTAFADTEEKKNNRTKLIDFIDREGVKPFIKTFVPSLFYPGTAGDFQDVIEKIREEGMTINPKTVMYYAAAMRDRNESLDLLDKHHDAVLLISGEKDQNVPIDQSKEMAKHLETKNFHIIPDSAHMSMFEQKELCLDIVREFVRTFAGK